jgi:outer membrane protein TolC
MFRLAASPKHMAIFSAKAIRLIMLFAGFQMLATVPVHGQDKQVVTIAILGDRNINETDTLLEQLRADIIAVVGQSAEVMFKEPLLNGFDIQQAASNYRAVLAQDVDIVLSYGVINNSVLLQEDAFPKPTLLFGSLNQDLLEIEEDGTSAINNLTYVVSPASYSSDLDKFQELVEFSKVGVIVDEFVIETNPVVRVLDDYFADRESSYSLIPITEGRIDSSMLDQGLDAVYVAGGFYMSDVEFAVLVEQINSRGLPSFSLIGKKDVVRGLLATNQPESNFNQLFRRIALNMEAIINGTPPADLPVRLDYELQLTVNATVADEIGFTIRYAMVGTADIVGRRFARGNADVIYSILDVMNGALERNLTLSAKEKSVRLSEQDVRVAGSEYLPELSADVNGRYLDPELAERSLGQNPEIKSTGSLNLSQVIYAPEASANVGIRRSLALAEQEDYNGLALDIVLESAIAYFNSLILKTNMSIQNQNIQVTKKNLRIAEQKFAAGASGKSDVLRFKSELAQNSLSLVTANSSFQQSLNQLNFLLNNPIVSSIDVEDAIIAEGYFNRYKYGDLLKILDNPKLRPKMIEFMTQEAMNNSPELKFIGYNLEAVQRSFQLNRTGRFFPTVALQGQYNLTLLREGAGSEPQGVFQVPPNQDYNLGVNVGLPIFQRNQRNIYQRTAIIQEEQLNDQRENIKLNISRSINDLTLDMLNQIANIELSKVAETSAQESLILTQSAYSEGAVPVIQLIDAQLNYLEAQLASATANYNYLIFSMQLERAMGFFFLTRTQAEVDDFLLRANQYILSTN